MKTVAEVIDAIGRLPPSERQEIEEYVPELIAKNWESGEKLPDTAESESAKE